MPGTIFVATDAIGAATLLPIHKFYYVMQHYPALFPARQDIDTLERRQVVNELCTRQRLAIPELGLQLYLNWDQLGQLAESGLEIAAHTQSHPWLAALPPEQQSREILESKRIIEEYLQRPVTGFAYPYGYPNSFGATASSLVEKEFQYACLSVTGKEPNNSPMQLPRRTVTYFYAA
jgi:peptidoglycan/xylan/chitin deacetylase (PgdA/CDA1 family)